MTTHLAPDLVSGRTAVVTGGANGIGAAIVRRLSACGAARGVVLDLATALGRNAPPEGWSEIAVDLRDDESVTNAFAEARAGLGSIDILVAAAGVVPAWSGIDTIDADEWDDVFRVNARGVMRSIQEGRRAMSEGAAIVVIASQNAWRGSPQLAGYTASKHAALGLVRSVALELGLEGIRVNAIGPGSVATDAYRGRLSRREAEGGLSVDEALERERLATPLRRLATPDEIAGAAVFLASDLASGITGHVLPVGAPPA
jgi:NAD(P)-dependent dehydrogenase (short-subunit alcohol dehydrogenase family)